MKTFDVLDALCLGLALALALLAFSGCDCDLAEPDSGAAPAPAPTLDAGPDAAPACLPAYVTDGGATVEERCAVGVCIEHVCLPCGAPGELCCQAGPFAYCSMSSCVSGVCE